MSDMPRREGIDLTDIPSLHSTQAYPTQAVPLVDEDLGAWFEALDYDEDGIQILPEPLAEDLGAL